MSRNIKKGPLLADVTSKNACIVIVDVTSKNACIVIVNVTCNDKNAFKIVYKSLNSDYNKNMSLFSD